MPLSSATLVDVVIVTVLPEEFHAVHRKLGHAEKVQGSVNVPNLYNWHIGQVSCAHTHYLVAVGMQGRSGNRNVTDMMGDVLAQWQPRYIFLVGIAGGLLDPTEKDSDKNGIRKGDVVVTNVIFDYEYAKIDKQVLPRYDRTYRTDVGLFNGACGYIGDSQSNWRGLITVSPPQPCQPKVKTGIIASGDKVIDNPDHSFFKAISETWHGRLTAVEMEGAGAASAIEHAHSRGYAVGFAMIRGISDLPRLPGNEGTETRGRVERDNWTMYAADTAASFTVGYISSGLPVVPMAADSGLYSYLDTLSRKSSTETRTFVENVKQTIQQLDNEIAKLKEVKDLHDQLNTLIEKTPQFVGATQLQSDTFNYNQLVRQWHFIKEPLEALQNEFDQGRFPNDSRLLNGLVDLAKEITECLSNGSRSEENAQNLSNYVSNLDAKLHSGMYTVDKKLKLIAEHLYNLSRRLLQGVT